MTLVEEISVEEPVPHPTPEVAAAALLFGFLLLMIGNGLQGTLIGVRSQIEGFSGLATTLVMTGYFAGFLIGAKLASRALGNVGHIRVFTALASMASTAALLHATFVHPAVWVAMRFLTGVCMAGLYVVAESWLNDITTNATRGRLLAAYQIVTMGGFAIGQLLLRVDDPQQFTLFVLASVLCSMALVPIALSTSSAPALRIPEPMPLLEMAKLVPTGLVSAILIGFIQGTFMGMVAVYATRAGLNATEVSRFMFAPMVGAVLFQYPIGRWSDRVSRRGIMLAICLVTAAISLILMGTDPASTQAVGLMFLLGGAIFPLYSLSLAYLNDWVPPNKIVGASATFVLAGGIGAICGPFVAGILMNSLGNDMYFLGLIAPSLVLASYLVWRIAFRDAVPEDRKGRWVPVASRGSVIVAAVVSAPGRVKRPLVRGKSSRRTK